MLWSPSPVTGGRLDAREGALGAFRAHLVVFLAGGTEGRRAQGVWQVLRAM